MPLDILVAEKILWHNPPENSAITKEVVRLMKMLDDSNAEKVLKLIRCAIELFAGKKISIPNEIQSHLKDERTPVGESHYDGMPVKLITVKSKTKKHKGLTRFWEETENTPKEKVKNKKLKPKRAPKRIWLM